MADVIVFGVDHLPRLVIHVRDQFAVARESRNILIKIGRDASVDRRRGSVGHGDVDGDLLADLVTVRRFAQETGSCGNRDFDCVLVWCC